MSAGYPDALVAQVRDWLLQEIGSASTPFVLGLSALQGTGKSTFAAQLVAAMARAGLPTLTLSLDDVYLPRHDRRALARNVHPLLATRGVPGTHDVALLHATLDALPHASADVPVALPRFDKGTDDRAPYTDWQRIVAPPRLLILEGWCLGVTPQTEAELAEPVNALERDEDPDGRWRHHVNTAIAEHYLPLWARLDRLLVLLAPGFNVVRAWRNEQEDALRAINAPQAMSPAAVDRFISHYERLSRHALATLPAQADLLLRLDAQRRHDGVFAPRPNPSNGARSPRSIS